jgi:predicted metal-dependent phosphoesterase TrpH
LHFPFRIYSIQRISLNLKVDKTMTDCAMINKPLKADFHIHTGEDPLDRVPYSAYEMIHKAFEEGFEVLAITNHNSRTFNQELFSFARDLGILLIPGIEANVENRHVLVLNPPPNAKFTNFASLKSLNRPDSLVVAPHPYFPGLRSLNGYLIRNLHLFHALEYCHFYSPHLNFNHRVEWVSRFSGISLLGNSDAHFLEQLGTTHSLVYAEKNMEAIFTAIRKGKVQVVTKPLSPLQMGSIMGRFIGRKLLGKKPVAEYGING